MHINAAGTRTQIKTAFTTNTEQPRPKCATRCQRETDLQRETACVMHLVIKCPVYLGGENSWKLGKIPAVSKGITSLAPSAQPSSKHTSQINAYLGNFLITWSAHFVGFFPNMLVKPGRHHIDPFQEAPFHRHKYNWSPVNHSKKHLFSLLLWSSTIK